MMVKMVILISMLLQEMFTKKKAETGTKLATSEDLKDYQVQKVTRVKTEKMASHQK